MLINSLVFLFFPRLPASSLDEYIPKSRSFALSFIYAALRLRKFVIVIGRICQREKKRFRRKENPWSGFRDVVAHRDIPVVVSAGASIDTRATLIQRREIERRIAPICTNYGVSRTEWRMDEYIHVGRLVAA